MHVHTNHLASPDTLGDAKAQEAAEKAQRAERDRDCKGLRVLEWLQKEGPSSLREYIAHLERRLAATPRLVEGHHKRRKLVGDLNRELRAKDRPDRSDVLKLKERFEEERRKLYAQYPEMGRYYFPPGYVVRSEAEEVAQIRCKLSRARLDFQIWNRTGQRPQGAGYMKLCSPQPGRPLTLWTIGGFLPHDATLNKGQLSEIELIAGGLARNPRTRTGMPVVTITGGFAPGESASVGEARARAVKNALLDALKRIDLSLLQYVGFNLATNAWCSDVAIALRERIAPAPDVRLRISPDDPRVQPRNPMAPTGTPLPKGPGPAPRSRGVQDQVRRRIDGILRRHGVRDAALRRAIADSAMFQGETGVKAAVGNTGLSSEEQNAIVEQILSRGRP
ncbi:MAG: hypothetical protein WCC08_23700 [Terrimicrobiaceae bacterium]